MKMAIFPEENALRVFYSVVMILSTQRRGGGDLEENGHFPGVKRFLLIILYEMSNGGDLYKMTIFPK